MKKKTKTYVVATPVAVLALFGGDYVAKQIAAVDGVVSAVYASQNGVKVMKVVVDASVTKEQLDKLLAVAI